MTGLTSPVFVGRVAELARLEAALRRSVSGEPRAVLVLGEAGVGKSRLLEEFAGRARDTGALVLGGGCQRLAAGGLPYLPFVEALRALARAVPAAELRAILGPARAELGRLLPELHPEPRSERERAEGGPHARTRLFELFLGVAERLSDRSPVVLLIEDLQWSDRSSRDLLLFLVRNVRRGRLMVVSSCRADELHPGDDVLALLAELDRTGRVERLELPTLGREELAAQLESILGTPPRRDLVDRILARTGGNPFFTEELLAAGGGGMPEELPPRLRDVLLSRIAGLSRPARDVVRVASVGGGWIDDGVLADVVKMPEAQRLEGLREAVARHILLPAADAGGTGDGYRFRHSLLQQAVYAQLLPTERRLIHAAYAQALSAGTEERQGAIELAHHWYAARDAARALPAAIEAGMSAEQVYAYEEAGRHYERALELWDRVPYADDRVPADRVHVLRRAAEAAALTGRYARAIEFGRKALELLDPNEDPVRVAAIHERLRFYLWEAGDHEAALADAEESVRIVPVEPPSATRANVLGHLAWLYTARGEFAASRALAEEALAVARAAGAVTEEALALGVLGWDLVHLGDPDGGVARIREAWQLAHQVGGALGLGLAYSHLSAVLERVGRVEEALSVALEGMEVAGKLGLERSYGSVLAANAASCLYALGSWREADVLIRDAVEVDLGGPEQLWLHLTYARLDAAQGRSEAAAGRLERARALAEQTGSAETLPIAAAAAELSLTLGRVEEARATAAVALRSVKTEVWQPVLGTLFTLALRAEAEAAGRARATRDADGRRKAERSARRLLDGLRSLTGPAPTGERGAVLALAEAERSRALGRADPAQWEVARAAWEGLGRPYPAAYAAFRQAEALLERGSTRAQVEQILVEADRIALALGAEPLHREIDALARGARIDIDQARQGEGQPGAADRAALSANVDESAAALLGLTDREREVLALVAAGWTNRQIAAALFISPKTASVHVSNILGKLGASGRVQAAGIAHRLGLARDLPAPVLEGSPKR